MTTSLNLYEVKLVWRFQPTYSTRRAAFYTRTRVVLAPSAYLAATHAMAGFSKDGDVSKVGARVTARYSVADGEGMRRCKGDRWDGLSSGYYLPVELMNGSWVIPGIAATGG